MAATIGVLALQGAFAAHGVAMEACGAKTLEVRTVEQLTACDGLIIPGGESTTMSKLLRTFDLVEPLVQRLAVGLPVFGTCAGMILLSAAILDGREDQTLFSAIDLTVRRNGYGRQIDSFETDLAIAAIGEEPFRAVFIRAPLVEAVGAEVEVLASIDDNPVLCRQGGVMVSSFHPELTADYRLHRLFYQTVAATL